MARKIATRMKLKKRKRRQRKVQQPPKSAMQHCQMVTIS